MLDKNFFSIYFDHLHNRLQTVNTLNIADLKDKILRLLNSPSTQTSRRERSSV